MRLVFALLAESAIVTAEGRVSMLGAGFDLLELDDFPHVQQQLAVAFQIELDRREADESHSVSVGTLDPKGHLLGKEAITTIPAASGSPVRHPDLPVGATFVLTMHGMRFPTPGDYRFVISVDSQQLGALRLRLLPKQLEAPEQPKQLEAPRSLRFRRGRH